jgi:cobalt-precorrin-7 (C5)-methyltransferase
MTLYVMGIGPGASGYVLPVVFETAAQCDVLCGGRRQLSLFERYTAEKMVISGAIEQVMERIQELSKTKTVGIVVSGDPGFYSLLSTLLKHFDRESLQIIPGISSLQYLFAKAALPWQDAYLTSFHGRSIDSVETIVNTHAIAAFLTDSKMPVNKIARVLIEKGVKNRRVIIGENLSYPDERIRDISLGEAAEITVSDLCVMVVYDEKE